MIFFDLDVKTFEDLIKTVDKKLLKNKMVKSSFCKEILKREKEFPTGLKLKEMNIAIPHVEASHTLVNKIVPIKLKSFIEMKEMGSTDKLIKVKYLFLLLIKDKEKHMDKLSKLILLFRDINFINDLKKCENYSDFKKLNIKALEGE